MLADTTVDQDPARATGKQRRFPVLHWQTILLYAIVLVLLGVALAMRLYNLGLPFDRDSYDEGVYWQSLRAMSAGHALYQQTFYSQPPFFLLSTYPFYVLFGSTLESARLGVALISLLGLIGAFLLGRAISGRVAGIVALLLLTVDPSYLTQSQTLQAEAPSIAFGLLAVGLAYLWWKQPNGVRGMVLAGCVGVTLSLSILCKLLGLAYAVPIVLLMLARIWQISRQPRGTRPARFADLWPVFVGLGAFLLTTFLVLLPFLGSFSQMWQSVVTFHTAASTLLKDAPRIGQAENFLQIQSFLTTMLSVAAFFGTVAALLRRDWRVLSLVAWLLATIYLLDQQVPLFHHHLVALIPPLLALAGMGIGPIPTWRTLQQKAQPILTSLTFIATGIAFLLILVVTFLNILSIQSHYQHDTKLAAEPLTQQAIEVAQLLQSITTPGELIVTDTQFIAGLADRSTPPLLVDTSTVRIETGYLTLTELEDEAAQSQVHVVLLFTGRLARGDPNYPQLWVASLHPWLVAHGFHLQKTYGLDGIGQPKELWVR